MYVVSLVVLLIRYVIQSHETEVPPYFWQRFRLIDFLAIGVTENAKCSISTRFAYREREIIELSFGDAAFESLFNHNSFF